MLIFADTKEPVNWTIADCSKIWPHVTEELVAKIVARATGRAIEVKNCTLCGADHEPMTDGSRWNCIERRVKCSCGHWRRNHIGNNYACFECSCGVYVREEK